MSGYIHGYDDEEQKRLIRQAVILEPYVYKNIDFSLVNSLTELGSGVGAQSKLILNKYPNLNLTCVDYSSEQLDTAKKNLHDYSHRSIQFIQSSADNTPIESNSMDAVYICWLLEHLQEPIKVIEEAYRILKPGGLLVCNEVLNSTFFIDPYSPSTLKYWFEFNDVQYELGGDPHVGAKLGNFLHDTCYTDIEVLTRNLFFDKRQVKVKVQFMEYWKNLILSGAEEIIKKNRVSRELVEEVREEFDSHKVDPNSVFYYSFVQAKARKPSN